VVGIQKHKTELRVTKIQMDERGEKRKEEGWKTSLIIF
jgi:hypothetical protein